MGDIQSILTQYIWIVIPGGLVLLGLVGALVVARARRNTLEDNGIIAALPLELGRPSAPATSFAAAAPTPAPDHALAMETGRATLLRDVALAESLRELRAAIPAKRGAAEATFSLDDVVARITRRAGRGRAVELSAHGTTQFLAGDDPTAPQKKKLDEATEHLKAGRIREAVAAFRAVIELGRTIASRDPTNPWPHVWSAIAWRYLSMIAEASEEKDVALACLKEAYDSIDRAFDLQTERYIAALKELARRSS